MRGPVREVAAPYDGAVHSAPLHERAVTYGAVGTTRADDLLDYPPAGYRPLERRAMIGHGDARWEWAWTQTLSWGIQRRSGFRVQIEEAPLTASELRYQPVGFDAAGNPVQPAVVGEGGEQVFLPDGSALLRSGDSAWLGIRFLLLRLRFPCRVVYVLDEPQRRGFAYGTLPGHAERGEEAFLVDRHDDGSVWITIRAFSRPANAFWWLVDPVLRIAQHLATQRYLRALAGPIPAGSGTGAENI